MSLSPRNCCLPALIAALGLAAFLLFSGPPAQAQTTHNVQVSDPGGSPAYWDATQMANHPGVGGGNCTPPMTSGESDSILCSTTIISFGDSVKYTFEGATLGGQHTGTQGACPGGSCAEQGTGGAGTGTFTTPFFNPSTDIGKTFTAGPFSPCTPGVNCSGDGTTNNQVNTPSASVPYFCQVHFAAMTGTVVVQDYSITLAGPFFTYVNTPVSITGTMMGEPKGVLPYQVGGLNVPASYGMPAQAGMAQDMHYLYTVSLGANSSSGKICSITAGQGATPAQDPATTAVACSVTETAVADNTITMAGVGITDPSSLARNGTAALHVISLAVTPPGAAIVAPPTNGSSSGSFTFTFKGTFPAGNVNITCTNMPAHATCAAASFNPTLASPQMVMVTVNTDGIGAAPGNYTPTIQATPSGMTAKSATFNLTIAPDYTISVAPASATVPPGPPAGNTFTATLTAVGDYQDTVAVTCGAGAPMTCNVTGSPAALTTNGSQATVQIQAGNPSVGQFNFSIHGAGNDAFSLANDSNTVSLTVAGFVLNTPSGSPSAAIGNPSQPVTFHLASNGNFTGTVTLSCGNAPAPAPAFGGSCTFFPSSTVQLNGTGSDVQVSMVVNTGAIGSAGSYPFNVQGVAGPETEILNSPGPSYTLAVTSSGNVDMGASISHTVVPGPGPVVQVGMGITYKVTATSAASSTNNATGVVMTVGFSNPVQLLQINAGAGATCTAPGIVTAASCTSAAPVTPGGSTSMSVEVAAPFIRSLNAEAEVSSSSSDSNLFNNHAFDAAAQIRLRPFARNGLAPLLP